MIGSFLFLSSRDELYRIQVSKIVFFEADGNYTHFALCDKQRGGFGVTLAQMQKMLTDNLQEEASCFARVGKRFIINLNYVQHIEVAKGMLTLSDNSTFAFQLPIAKDALRKLKEMYIESIRKATN